MKKLMTIAVITVAVTALAAGGALAFRGGKGAGPGRRGADGPRGPRGEMVERLADQLDLTEAQRDTLRQARKENERNRIETHGQIELLRLEMRDLMEKDRPDRKAVLKLHEQIQDLQGKMARQQLEMRLLLRETLTDEQLAQLEELRGERRAMRQERREMRRERRGERQGERGTRGPGYRDGRGGGRGQGRGPGPCADGDWDETPPAPEE